MRKANVKKNVAEVSVNAIDNSIDTSATSNSAYDMLAQAVKHNAEVEKAIAFSRNFNLISKLEVELFNNCASVEYLLEDEDLLTYDENSKQAAIVKARTARNTSTLVYKLVKNKRRDVAERHEYIAKLISEHMHTKKDIVVKVASRFDSVKLITVKTEVNDCFHERYFARQIEKCASLDENKIAYFAN